MKRIYAVILVSLSLFVCMLASCIERDKAEGPRDDGLFTVTFYQGSEIMSQESVAPGGYIAMIPYGISWQDETGSLVDPVNITVDRNMSFYAYVDTAMRSGHVRYMATDGDTFHPDDPVTRGQLAQIAASLLVPEMTITGSQDAKFVDVPAGSEYYDSVQTLAAHRIMSGFGDGTFRPEQTVTRAELVTVICRLMGQDEITALVFPDVPAEHWALGAVAAAATNGWIAGYGDGNFYPDIPVTRAETAAVIDRIRTWNPNRLGIDAACEQSPYSDVSQKHWAYYPIMDAAYTNEMLSYIYGEAKDIKPGFILLDGKKCHVNAESLRLDYFEGGFHNIKDGLDTDGVYYVPENGYAVQRNKTGLQELDGSMFYVEKEDGPFLSDFDLGYLHFGEDGRYTSGDPDIDYYVDEIMGSIINGKTENLLNEDKLREAYLYIRDGGFSYMSRPEGWVRGCTGWEDVAGKTMLESRRGNCYNFAAALCWLARRLGFQAYCVVGGVNGGNFIHAWVMIDDEKGDEYIYDVEMEWGYRYGHYGYTRIVDLFKQLRGHSRIPYFFPGDTYTVPPNDTEELFEDTMVVIWPTVLGESAYVEVDGELVALETTWAEMFNEDGVLTGYTVTATYNGVTYSTIVSVAADPNAGEEEDPNASPSIPPEESVSPSEDPTVSSEQPSEVPSEQPSEAPSEQPSEQPSEAPSEQPSEAPSEPPSSDPTEAPPSDSSSSGGGGAGGIAEQDNGDPKPVSSE